MIPLKRLSAAGSPTRSSLFMETFKIISLQSIRSWYISSFVYNLKEYFDNYSQQEKVFDNEMLEVANDIECWIKNVKL